jgi:hypothetical protein
MKTTNQTTLPEPDGMEKARVPVLPPELPSKNLRVKLSLSLIN